jgi:hypothetical protein
MLIRPKLICLDSSTWGNIARDRDHDSHARKLIARFRVGDVIPFLTWHHVAELAHHGSEKVFYQRVALLRFIPFIAFPKQPQEKAYIGSIVDLRNAEVSEAFRDPTADHATLIERAASRVVSGFASGTQLCGDNEEWWEIYRQHFADNFHKRDAEISALTHFPTANVSEKVFGRDHQLRPLKEAQVQFKNMAQALTRRLKRDVKKTLPNAEILAEEFMREAYEDGLSMYQGENLGIDALLDVYGVDRTRLPKNASVADVGEEAVFIKQLAIHESHFGLPIGTLQRVITKEMLPSWLVWRDIGRALLKLPKAEPGNVIDKSILPFGLYVDGLQVDKRIRDAIRRAAPSSKLLDTIQTKLLKATRYKDLLMEVDSFVRS